jgi:hypothetical protein
MAVEFEEPQVWHDSPKIRVRKRVKLVSKGNIAEKQRLRKIAKRKPTKEVSLMVIRRTSSFVGKTTAFMVGKTVGTAKGVYWGLKESTGQVARIVKLARPDDERQRFFGTRECEMGGRRGIVGDGEGRGDSWTSLSDLFDVSEENGENIPQDEELSTIQEIAEPSHLEKQEYNSQERYSTSMEDTVHDIEEQTISPSVQKMAEYLHSLSKPQEIISPSPSRQSSENASSKSLHLPESPKSLRRISPDIFNPKYSSPNHSLSDPIKPLPSIPTMPAEITRSSISYSEIHLQTPQDSPRHSEESTMEKEYERSRHSMESGAVSVVEQWKWDSHVEMGKSVRERVRELDLAIDSAFHGDLRGKQWRGVQV